MIGINTTPGRKFGDSSRKFRRHARSRRNTRTARDNRFPRRLRSTGNSRLNQTRRLQPIGTTIRRKSRNIRLPLNRVPFAPLISLEEMHTGAAFPSLALAWRRPSRSEQLARPIFRPTPRSGSLSFIERIYEIDFSSFFFETGRMQINRRRGNLRAAAVVRTFLRVNNTFWTAVYFTARCVPSSHSFCKSY